jgi:hypothetical protein
MIIYFEIITIVHVFMNRQTRSWFMLELWADEPTHQVRTVFLHVFSVKPSS